MKDRVRTAHALRGAQEIAGEEIQNKIKVDLRGMGQKKAELMETVEECTRVLPEQDMAPNREENMGHHRTGQCKKDAEDGLHREAEMQVAYKKRVQDE